MCLAQRRADRSAFSGSVCFVLLSFSLFLFLSLSFPLSSVFSVKLHSCQFVAYIFLQMVFLSLSLSLFCSLPFSLCVLDLPLCLSLSMLSFPPLLSLPSFLLLFFLFFSLPFFLSFFPFLGDEPWMRSWRVKMRSSRSIAKA